MPELPLPLPALAGLAGIGGFLGARLLSSAGTPTPDAAPAADATDAGNAQASDLFGAFAGDGGVGLGDTGGGTVNGVYPIPPPNPYDPGGIPPGTSPLPPAGGLQGNGAGPPVPPAPVPRPAGAPAAAGARPSGASGWVQATGIPTYKVVSGVASAVTVSSNVVAWVGPAAHYKPNATLRRILTGGHAGQYVHVTNVTVH